MSGEAVSHDEDCSDCPACRWQQGEAAAARGECCNICHQPFHAPGEAPVSGSQPCWRCRPPRGPCDGGLGAVEDNRGAGRGIGGQSSMSVELRFRIEGTCDHGPKGINEPREECTHRLVCDWGEIEHADPRPGEGNVGHLVLVPGWWAGSMLGKPPKFDHRYGYTSVTSDGDRLFIHMDHKAGRWTWELFPAHFEDLKGPDNLLIGRWPD